MKVLLIIVLSLGKKCITIMRMVSCRKNYEDGMNSQ